MLVLVAGQTGWAETKIEAYAKGDKNLAKLRLDLLQARTVELKGKASSEVIAKNFPHALRGGKLQCVVGVTALSSDLEQACSAAGVEIVSEHSFSPTYNVIVIRCSSLSQLDALVARSDVKAIVPEARAVTHVGAVTSQADVAIGAANARTTYSVDGSGSIIGVLSNSLNKDLTDGTLNAGVLTGSSPQIAGDLPTNVFVIDEGPAPTSATDEGRAMMEVAYDMAPMAGLSFASAKTGYMQFVTNIADLRTNAGSSNLILVDDTIYAEEPLYQDGPIAVAANTAAMAGVPYVVAAGNDGDNAHESAYFDADGGNSEATMVPPLTGVDLHAFDGMASGDTHLGVQLVAGATLTAILKWDEPYDGMFGDGGGARSDLDLYLVSDETLPIDGNIVGMSQNLQGTEAVPDGEPYEIIEYNSVAGETVYLAINFVQGRSPNGLHLTIRIAGGGSVLPADAGLVGDRTLQGHALAANVLTVGSVDYQELPGGGGNAMIDNQPNSSRGGDMLPILFDSAGIPLGAPASRSKPDLSGPDGVDTTFFGIDTGDTGTDPNFFGTSCAAAHVAGVAALAIQARNQPMADLTDTQAIYDCLTGTADPVADPLVGGAGVINALAAIAQKLEPTPTNTSGGGMGSNTPTPTPTETQTPEPSPTPTPFTPSADCPQSTTGVIVVGQSFTSQTLSGTDTYVISLENGVPAIPYGVTLTVTNGVRFVIDTPSNVQTLHKNFDVYGTLIIDSPVPVVFEACAGKQWGAIRIFSDETQAPSMLKNVTLRNAGGNGSRRFVPFEPGIGLGETEVQPVNSPYIWKIIELTANHCIRLSGLPHVLDTVRFQNCRGCPVMADAPLDQSIENIVLPPGYHDPVTGKYNALAVADARGERTTRFEGVTTDLSVAAEFEFIHFPIDAEFDPTSNLQVAAGAHILMGSRAVLRCLGQASFIGGVTDPVTIDSASSERNWSRVELLGSAPQTIQNASFANGGAPAPIPLFADDGINRTFAGVGTRLGPGCAVLMSESNHVLADLTLENWQRLLFLQDVRIQPSYQGIITVQDSAPGVASLPAIGILDFTDGREQFPLVFQDDYTLAPVTTAEFVFSPSLFLKGVPLNLSPAYFFDRDVIVPRNFRLTLEGGDLATNDFLLCLFSKREIVRTNQITNLQGGKNELAIVGGISVNADPINPGVLTSTDYITPFFKPLVDEEAPEQEPGDETDMNETDFKDRSDSDKGILGELLSDLGFTIPDDTPEVAEAIEEEFDKVLPNPSHAFDWAGIIVTNEADDLETVIENLDISNAINGVTFLTSSGTVRGCFIHNCFGSGVSCLDRSFPVVDSNAISGIGQAGIAIAYGSSPQIRLNTIGGNNEGTGVFITEQSHPVLTQNVITGNKIGVFIEANSSPNLGRVSGHPLEGTTIPQDPGYDTDDGGNSIFANIGTNGFVINVINNTPNRIFAQNNNWGLTDPVQIDATIYDDNEAGIVPGLDLKAGQVIVLPLSSQVTPTPVVPNTPAPTATRTPRPTIDPNQLSATPTKTRIAITAHTPTPTPTSPPVSADIVQDLQLAGVIRIATDITVNNGISVTLAPGTKLIFENGASMHLKPNARILANGTEQDPIFFFAPLGQTWGGLLVEGSGFIDAAIESQFVHCVFQRSAGPALVLQNVKTLVDHCEFRDNQAGILVAGNARTQPRIRNSDFRNHSFTAIAVNLVGAVPPGTPDSGIFNLGIGRANIGDTTNVDPGFNTFTQPIGTAGSDVFVASYLNGRTFRVEENLFLIETPDGFTDLAAPIDVTASGRVGSAGLVSISVKAPPRLTNVVRDGDSLVVTDDEVWGGVIAIGSVDRFIEIAEDVTVRVLPGTRVLFVPDGTSVSGLQATLRVRGTLLTEGKLNQPVVFGSLFEFVPGDLSEFDWGGLELVAKADGSPNLSQLNHTEIRHAAIGVTSYAGDRSFFNDVLIENCGDTAFAAINLTVDDSVGFVVKSKEETVKTSLDTLNKRGLVKGIPIAVSRPTLNRVFLLGGSRGEFGLYSLSSEPVLSQCVTGVDPRRNDYQARPFRQAALLVEGFRVPHLGTLKAPGHNMFAGTASPGEGKYEILLSTSVPLSAIGNYWLAGGVSDIKDKIFDGDEAVSSGLVSVSPFLGRPPSVDRPGGDLDQDAFYFPNDFVAFMKGVTGSIPSDMRFSNFADRDQNHVIDFNDVFIYALTYHERGVRPALELPPTATPAPPTATRTPRPQATPTPTEIVLGTGDVQLTLTWDTAADIDLFVTDPFGDIVAYFNPSVPSGGMLDVDDLGACVGEEGMGPENVFWPDNEAPPGDYFFEVSYFSGCGLSPVTNWTVLLKRTGVPNETFTGTLEIPGDITAQMPFTFEGTGKK